jgi:hypothetical protein
MDVLIKCLNIFIGWYINIYDKTIRDNYRIYGLRIVKTIKTITSVKIMDFQTPLLNHLTMFLSYGT